MIWLIMFLLPVIASAQVDIFGYYESEYDHIQLANKSYISGRLLIFENLDDQSFILAPQLNWDAFEDVTLGAWVSQSFGENDSEFGIQDLALRFRLRAYF